jgi:hypothetical protein
MAEWFDSLSLLIKLIIAITGFLGIGGGSVLLYVLFRKLYLADVAIKQSTAEKNRADAAKLMAETENFKINSFVISDAKNQKHTVLSVDEVQQIVKNFGIQLQENAKLQESVHDAVLLADRRRTENDELKGVVQYQRDEMREARAELKEAVLELGKCTGECASRDDKIAELERRLRRAEQTLSEHDLLPNPAIHQTHP